jgi:hypothetical protein
LGAEDRDSRDAGDDGGAGAGVGRLVVALARFVAPIEDNDRPSRVGGDDDASLVVGWLVDAAHFAERAIACIAAASGPRESLNTRAE